MCSQDFSCWCWYSINFTTLLLIRLLVSGRVQITPILCLSIVYCCLGRLKLKAICPRVGTWSYVYRKEGLILS